MSQPTARPHGVIKIFVDDYDRLHFRIEPATGRRIGYSTGRRDRIRRILHLPSRGEVKLRKQLYAIDGQESPDLWIPPRIMRKPYYEFTTRRMPDSGPRSSLMITPHIMDRQRALAFEHAVRNAVIEAFDTQNWLVERSYS